MLVSKKNILKTNSLNLSIIEIVSLNKPQNIDFHGIDVFIFLLRSNTINWIESTDAESDARVLFSCR